MTLSGSTPRCMSAPPHFQSYRELHPLADEARSVEEMSGRLHGAAALAVGGSDFARRVVEQRRKRLEARAGWLAVHVNKLWNEIAPVITRQG